MTIAMASMTPSDQPQSCMTATVDSTMQPIQKTAYREITMLRVEAINTARAKPSEIRIP